MKVVWEVAKKMCGYVININISVAMTINTRKPFGELKNSFTRK